MITASEERFIAGYAYVPEHLPGYVTAISGAEPHLLGDYLCYRAEDSLVFIGYALRSPFDEKAMTEALASALSRFRPTQVALTAPAISMVQGACRTRERDHYYRLALSCLSIPPKVRNMIRRASRELHVESTREMKEEHTRLVRELLDSRQLDEDTRYILERIPAYVSSVPTARVFNVRDAAEHLVGFDVAEFGARDYAFYQFNVRSRRHYIPGASDLLLREVIAAARTQGKPFINLGLGINEGVAHFKRKWGGRPFLAYEYCRYEPSAPRLFHALLQKL